MEKIKFKKRRNSSFKTGKSVGISEETYERVKDLSDKTGLTMGEVADDLLNHALEQVELED